MTKTFCRATDHISISSEDLLSSHCRTGAEWLALAKEAEENRKHLETVRAAVSRLDKIGSELDQVTIDLELHATASR